MWPRLFEKYAHVGAGGWWLLLRMLCVIHNWKVTGLIPRLPQVHINVSLSKILQPMLQVVTCMASAISMNVKWLEKQCRNVLSIYRFTKCELIVIWLSADMCCKKVSVRVRRADLKKHTRQFAHTRNTYQVFHQIRYFTTRVYVVAEILGFYWQRKNLMNRPQHSKSW